MAEAKAIEVEVEEGTESWGTIDTKPTTTEPPKVEYELEGDTEEEVQAKKTQSENNEEEKKEPSELEGIETQGAQKRIRQLIKQRKDREDQINELQHRIAEYEATIQAKDNELVSTLKLNNEVNEQQLQEQIKLAESAYRKALDSGETDEIVAAQRLLNKSEVELSKVSDAKVQYDKTVIPEQQIVQPQQIQPNPNPADYDPKAVEWAANNPWFGQDQVMTAAALAIDAQLKDEGFDPSDVEFYGEVTSRLRNSFPTKFEDASQEQQAEPKVAVTKPSQVVGGASRTVTSPTTSRSNKVKLSKQDIDMANRWGIPLERYAEQKLVADQADGEYTTVLTNKRGG
tara:strand:- start:3893 stop:4921 length:1029 start_codon:yes stop_codon:yes gene_type:complete